MISELNFDSQIFDLNVGKLEITNTNFQIDYKDLNEYDLVYVFSNTKLDGLDYKWVDTKLTFDLDVNNSISQAITDQNEQVSEFNIDIHDFTSLKKLAFLSGIYSRFKNEAEIAYLIFNYSSQNERFKTISFGPFQMQLRFIDDILIKASKKNIKDTILKNYSTSNYQYLIDNLEHLNKLSTQWEILKCFEKINLKKKSKFKDNSQFLKKLIQLYNSGSFDPKINDQAFSKITCSNKSYESWCYEMKEWMLE